MEYDFHISSADADACFEIVKIEDDDDIGIHNEFPIYDSLEDSQEEDVDRVFGALIAERLREITPAAQKEIKRNITELLYS